MRARPKSSTLSRPSVREEEVRRLDVAVDDALLVGGGEDVERLLGVAQHLADGELADALGAVAERLADEQLHHQEGRAVLGHVDVADLHGARVTEAVDRLRLALEAQADLLRLGRLAVEDLERVPPPDAVDADVHGRHAADAEEAHQRPLVADQGARRAAGSRLLAFPDIRAAIAGAPSSRHVECGRIAGRSHHMRRAGRAERRRRRHVALPGWQESGEEAAVLVLHRVELRVDGVRIVDPVALVLHDHPRVRRAALGRDVVRDRVRARCRRGPRASARPASSAR